jgi:hypothetical protein
MKMKEVGPKQMEEVIVAIACDENKSKEKILGERNHNG